jgi:hypothetical protein
MPKDWGVYGGFQAPFVSFVSSGVTILIKTFCQFCQFNFFLALKRKRRCNEDAASGVD